MKKFASIFFTIFLFYFLINMFSCTYENEEDLLDEFLCDTNEIVYTDLTYIFTGICTNCHGDALSYKGIKMNTYENVKTSINTGRVWRAINHEDGIRPMPDGLPKLSDCEIKKIAAWINAGMPEN